MKSYILYIHGFNSAPGGKVGELKEGFPNHTILAPKLPNNPHEAISILKNLLNDKEKVHIIGNSLGGFYALVLASIFKEKDDFYYYLINPQLWPVDSFTSRINEKLINFKNGKNFTIENEFINCLKELESSVDIKVFSYIDWFFGEYDIVIDSKKTLDYLYSLKIPFNYNISPQGHCYKDITYLIESIREKDIGL